MKTIKLILFFAVISTLSLTCKKEGSLMDLSGNWTITFQPSWAIDSIDAAGKPYFGPWWFETYTFELTPLNKEKTIYQKVTRGIGGMRDTYKIDTVGVDLLTGIISMTLYNNEPDWGFGLQQAFVGFFTGKYSGSNSHIEGNVQYTAWWYCDYCPIGNEDRSAPVTHYTFAKKQD